MANPVLGNRDILVRIRTPGSVPLVNVICPYTGLDCVTNSATNISCLDPFKVEDELMVQPIGAEEAVIEFHMERSREIAHLRTALFQVEDVLMLRSKAWRKQPCWNSQ
jgi:hypothetical protein